MRMFGLMAVLAVASLASPALAEYPERPIRLIIPLAPGGGTDITARTVGDAVAEEWNATIVPENKVGGATTIASQAVVAAPADGYTVYVNTASFLISARLTPNLPYDAKNDFVPVSLLASSDHVLVVSPKIPVSNFDEFKAWVRSKNGAATFASFGAGSSSHLGFELFLSKLGLSMVHVPYRGNAPAMTDLLGGHVDVMFADHVDEALKSSGVKIIAIAGARRSPEIPDVPTLEEKGMTGFRSNSFYGLMVRKGTPQDIVDKWSAASRKVLQLAAVRNKLAVQGIDAYGTSPAEYAAFLESEDRKYAEAAELPTVRSIKGAP